MHPGRGASARWRERISKGDVTRPGREPLTPDWGSHWRVNEDIITFFPQKKLLLSPIPNEHRLISLTFLCRQSNFTPNPKTELTASFLRLQRTFALITTESPGVWIVHKRALCGDIDMFICGCVYVIRGWAVCDSLSSLSSVPGTKDWHRVVDGVSWCCPPWESSQWCWTFLWYYYFCYCYYYLTFLLWLLGSSPEAC